MSGGETHEFGTLRWFKWYRTCLPMQEMQETRVSSLGQEDPLEKGTAYPCQCFCLGNPMDRGAWWATVHGVPKGSDATYQLNSRSTALTADPVRGVQQRKPSVTAGEEAESATTVGDSLTVSDKTKQTLTVGSYSHSPWCLPKGAENLHPHKHLHMDV